ncbi:hypothetical protein GEMRC1_007959 [Eukaryota sp. GEM-RC1]
MNTVILLSLLFAFCFSLKFELTGFDERIFIDEFPSDTFIVGDIGSTWDFGRDTPLTQVDFRIEAPNGEIVYSKVDMRTLSQFAFTTNIPGQYSFYISSRISTASSRVNSREVVFKYRLGETPESMADLAKTEQLKPLEVELTRLQEQLRTVHTTQLYLRDLTVHAAEANEITNARIPYFTLLIVCLIVATSIVQSQFLKKDLKRTKIH